MKKVRKTVRLYRIHDLDLISFINSHKLNFQKSMYCALKSFSKGEVFAIKIPPQKKADERDYKKVYMYTLALDPQKDADCIKLLQKISNGKRNNFLKNLLRLYLCNPMSEDFLVDQADTDYFYNKFEIFRQGKRIVNLDQKIELNSTFSKQENVEKDTPIPIIPKNKEPEEQRKISELQEENTLEDFNESDQNTHAGEIADLFSAIIT